MKDIFEANFDKHLPKKSSICQILENQHPIMFWWFGLTTISFCSVYVMLFTKF